MKTENDCRHLRLKDNVHPKAKGQPNANNKNILYCTLYEQRVLYLWASYDGDSIVSEPAVAPLFSNSIYTATHQKISYGRNISSFLKGEDAKALNQIFFYEQSP